MFIAGFSLRVLFFYRQSCQDLFPPALQSVMINKVVNVVATSLSLDQTGRFKHPYMLGNGRLGNSQKSSQGIHAEGIRITLAAE